jgi:GTP pyrophosphokinase
MNTDTPTNSPITNRFDEAFVYAHQLHAAQTRKGSGTPYIAHLMSVAALVIESGGDEDAAIAGLLHDAVEDQGGQETLQEIERRFGDRVAIIVAGCTDADTIPKPPWQERKEQYLAHLTQAPLDVLRVSVADKLHNSRAILLDYRLLGEALWERFTGGKEGSLWYYRRLAEIYQQCVPGDSSLWALVEEIDRTVTELESLANST